MSTFTGTGTLLRLYLRRDRWHLVWWTVAVTLLYWSQAVSVAGLYKTQAEFDRAAASMQGNAAFIAMAGPTRALNTIGGQVTWQAAAFGAILAGLMSMFLLGRHTRVEEETGRDELVRSSAVGRHAPTTAGLLVVLLANVLLGVGVALSLILYPLPVADSLGLGLGLTVTGWVFAGTALVAMQLTASARSAYGLAGVVLAAAYALRAVGDVTGNGLSWASPIGWYQAMHAFSGLRWWPLLVLLLAAGAGITLGYALLDRRDAGSGLWAARPGPPAAGPGLRSGLGLAWRLQRGSVVAWSAGLLLAGLAYGSIGKDVRTLIGDSTTTQELFAQRGQDLVEGFYGSSMVMLALLACGFTISSALRPRAEEEAGRTEALLATGLSRSSWLLGHGAVTLAGTVLALGAAGLGLGAGYAAVTGDGSVVQTYLGDTLAYAAPVLLLGGVAWLLVGTAPRRASLAWLGLGFATVVMIFGEVLRLPQWLQALSPFEQLALVPAEPFRWVPVVVLGLLVLLTAWLARLTLLRRDLR